MAIYQLEQRSPQIHASVWVADSAQVIGDVVLGADSSVWFGSVLRGDNETIRIGQACNVQEQSVLHTDMGQQPLTLGDHVTVGHGVMLHGCQIGEGSLIGIGAVVLNGAKIGKYCLVGAGALVTQNQVFEDGSLILGQPAKRVRALTPQEIEGLNASAQRYVVQARRYQTGLQKIQPNFLDQHG